MIVGVTTTPHGTVGGGLGRAQTVAVADVRDGEVTSWTEVHVGWGDLHGIGPEGTHHARIVRFVREHGARARRHQRPGRGHANHHGQARGGRAHRPHR